MATSEPLIRPPQQRRSQESLERLLQAGFEVLQERGCDGFTLHEVSANASEIPGETNEFAKALGFSSRSQLQIHAARGLFGR